MQLCINTILLVRLSLSKRGEQHHICCANGFGAVHILNGNNFAGPLHTPPSLIFVCNMVKLECLQSIQCKTFIKLPINDVYKTSAIK